MSRQLAAHTTASDTLSCKWGKVCCDSCVEREGGKNVWRLGGFATWEGDRGLEKSGSSQQERIPRKWRKRHRVEASSMLQSFLHRFLCGKCKPRTTDVCVVYPHRENLHDSSGRLYSLSTLPRDSALGSPLSPRCSSFVTLPTQGMTSDDSHIGTVSPPTPRKKA